MRIYSWNVNGLRSAASKGFLGWLGACEGDIVSLQEVRARFEQLPPELASPEGWYSHFVAAERPGYSGVALYSRLRPDEVKSGLGESDYDKEGRVLFARFGALTVASVYFPNGNGKDHDNSRVPFKLAFYRDLYEALDQKKLAGEPILVTGDFNTAHKPIDLARPKQNEKTSGFLPEEREELSRWLRGGWVDTFRQFHPDAAERYSWWSQRLGARPRNIGWRIDLVLASPGALPYLRAAEIHDDVMGSDHCPISVDVADLASA